MWYFCPKKYKRSGVAISPAITVDDSDRARITLSANAAEPLRDQQIHSRARTRQGTIRVPKSSYDRIAPKYYDTGHVTSRNFDSAIRTGLVGHPFKVPPDGLVLELGAGRGRAGEFLRIPLSRIVQLDNSEVMLSLENREAALSESMLDVSRGSLHCSSEPPRCPPLAR
jgi:hypothetical protein